MSLNFHLQVICLAFLCDSVASTIHYCTVSVSILYIFLLDYEDLCLALNKKI